MKEYIAENLKTKMIGKNIIFYEEISSTQEIAKKFAEEQIENGSLILANKQTNGIGTHGRKWYTKENESIAFTIILYPKVGIEKLENLSIDVAVCMVEAVEELYGIKLDIKNPNDLMYHQKKLGGILTQITTSGETIKYLLIGIGLNVNTMQFPNELEKIATSLKKEFHKEFSKEKIICKFCEKLEKKIDKKC